MTVGARSILAVAFLAIFAGCDDRAGRGGVLSDVSAAGTDVRSPAPDFSLIDQNGDVLGLSDLRGKAIVLDFIFTNCPGPCPILTGTHVQLQRSLPPDLRDATHFVSITIDPKRDDPEALRNYAKARGVDPSDWSFLGGAPDEVEAVVGAYGIAVLGGSHGEMNHQLATYLIGPDGRIAEVYVGLDHDAAEIQSDLASLIP
jgi:protein SCO1/2